METKKLTIIDVSGQIEDFREMVRTFMLKIKVMDLKSGNDDSGKDFVSIISGCERLFLTLEKSNPEKLSDNDLFSLWESLFCIDQIRELPGVGTQKNLEMLKIVSTDRIRAYFDAYQLYTIGLDERTVSGKNGTVSMIIDIVLEEEGDQKLKNVDLPREYISVKREHYGIFVTIDAGDVPKLLARSSRNDDLIAGMKKTHRKVSGAISKMN